MSIAQNLRGINSGLDNAGKTTILKNLSGEDVLSVSPTLGFNIKTLVFDQWVASMWGTNDMTTSALDTHWIFVRTTVFNPLKRYSPLFRGRRRAEDLTTLLEELFWKHRRSCMGRWFRGSSPYSRLQRGITQVATGGCTFYSPFQSIYCSYSSPEACRCIAPRFCQQTRYPRVHDRWRDQRGTDQD